MEDQSTDPGDLTTDADNASVPQGKAARTRHRLPRQKVRQGGHDESYDGTADDGADETVQEAPKIEGEEAAEAVEREEAKLAAVAETPVAAETPDGSDGADADVSVVETTPTVPDEPAVTTTRRRPLWRRDKAAAVSPARIEPDETDPEASSQAVDESSDLVAETDTPTEQPAETGLAETGPAEAEGSEAEPAEAESADAEGDATDVAEPEPILVPHRPAGRVLKAAAVAAGVLFVAAGAFAGATLQPYLADRAAVQTKFAIAETAANAITTLWTYTPDDMDKLPERSAKYLGGDFATDYRRYIDAIAAPNKQAQVSNNTEVLGAAVESLTPTEATAIVYTNSVATSPVTKGIPSLRYLSYRLTMKRDANRWLITQMVAVTKLDLTPRL